MNKKILSSLICFGLFGCASHTMALKEVATASLDVNQKFQGSFEKIPSNPLFKKDDKPWLNPVPLPTYLNNKAQLPSIFKQEFSVNLSGPKISLSEVLSEMSRATSITFDVAQDVFEPNGGLGTVISSTASITAAPSAAAAQIQQLYVDNFVFKDGNLASALDVLATKTNLSWKWTGQSVSIFRYESRNYYISALAGKTTSNSTISSSSQAQTSGGASGNSTGGGQTGQSMNINTTFGTWDEITSYVRTMLSPKGRMSVLESAGIITVRDTPSVLSTVDKSVRELNAVLSKQVYVNVEVYSVVQSDADNYGINWDTVWSLANSKFNIGYQAIGNAVTGSNALNLGIIRGPLAGTSAIGNFLSTLGKSSVAQSTTITTLNGQPAPFFFIRERGIVTSVTANASAGSNVVQTTIVTSNINEGFTLNVLPKIQPDGDILLQFGIDLSEIEKIDTFTSGSSTVQTPTRLVRNALHRASIRSGQTLVLTGYQGVSANIDNKGVGGATSMFSPLLGGSQNSSNSRVQLVIMVTPYVAKKDL